MTEHLLIVWMATMVAAFCALIGRTREEATGRRECHCLRDDAGV